MKSLSKTIVVVCSVLLLLISAGYSQLELRTQQHPVTQETLQFRAARTFQQLNQHEKAIAILEPLYQSRPGNLQYYQALLESYLQLSRFDDALGLVQKQRERDSLNPRYDIDYGDVLFKSSRKDEALDIWKGLLEKFSQNPAVYTMVANTLIRNNLFDDGIQIYEQAYQKFPDRNYMLQNIANLYRTRLQYYKALKYYLAYLKKEPSQYKVIARQLLAFRLDSAQVDTLIGLLEREAQKDSQFPEIQILTAKFYQKYQRYDRALSIYKKLENEKTRGQYLFEFARSAQNDSVFKPALEAYQEIIKRFPDSPSLFQTYLGASQCYLELAQRENNQEYAKKALQTIATVQERYPKNPRLLDLQMLRGLIYKRYFFDIDKAIEIFLDVARNSPENSDTRQMAYLLSGESYLIKGNLDAAREVLGRIDHPQYQPKALYYLTKIAFYQGNYQAAQEYIDHIFKLEGISGSLTNDVLALQMLIPYSSTAPAALNLYLQADLLVFQQKNSEAISKLESALKENPPPEFRARVLLKAARMSVSLGKYAEAVSYCNRLIEDGELFNYADEGLFLMATIFADYLKDYPQAFKLYDRLLMEFPSSLYVSDARDRLKKLRQKFPEQMP